MASRRNQVLERKGHDVSIIAPGHPDLSNKQKANHSIVVGFSYEEEIDFCFG
jgi:glycogen synthase